MANQLDVNKLFKEKFESFELDNSANIGLAMEKKLQVAKFWYIFKWSAGIVVLTGLSLLVLLPKQLDDDSSQNILKKSAVELIAEKNKLEIENIEEIDDLEETSLVHDNIDTEAQVIEEFIEDAIIVKEEVQVENKSIEIEETEPMEIVKVQQQIEKLEPFVSSKKEFNQLAPKYSLIKLDEYIITDIRRTNLKLQAAKDIEEPRAKEKKKLHLPNEVESLPYGALGNMIGFGEIYAMPFLFNNLMPSALPTSDTITQSQVKESAQLSYQLGIAFRLQKKDKPWFIQTGLSYQNFKEKVDYNFRREYVDHDLSFWDYDSIYEYHIDPPNFDTVLVGVDSSYIEYWDKTENTKTNINSYTFLNIPLLIGCHFHNNNSPFSFQVSAGIGLSVLLRNTGYLYNNYGQIINYNALDLKPRLNWNILLNTTINYEFKKGNTLFARPSFQYQLDKTIVIDQL